MLGIFSSLKKEGSEQLRKENNCDLLEMEEILAESGYGMGSGTNINGFIEAKDENYDIIRAVLKEAG